MILLDTHVAIWFTTDTKFGNRSMTIVHGALAADELAISAISFREMAMLVGKKRLRALKSAGDLRGYDSCQRPAGTAGDGRDRDHRRNSKISIPILPTG